LKALPPHPTARFLEAERRRLLKMIGAKRLISLGGE